MSHERWLQRWITAGLIDETSAARIRAFEHGAHNDGGLGLPVRLLIGLGALAIAAGIVLFAAAQWAAMSSGARIALLVGTVAALHGGGFFAMGRLPVMARALHAVGTVSLGGAIFLVADTLALGDHWPTGLFFWAGGAWIAWHVLRDWPQELAAALLTPAWLMGAWIDVAEDHAFAAIIGFGGLLLMAVAYAATQRRILSWAGHLTLLPLAALSGFAAIHAGRDISWQMAEVAPSVLVAGVLVALAVPTATTAWLARASWRVLAVAVVWLLGLAAVGQWFDDFSGAYYLWLALGAVALTGWGVRSMSTLRINLGVSGFAITVLVFFFSSVFDKLGRSVSLLLFGLLLVGGGWALEYVRRRLLKRMSA